MPYVTIDSVIPAGDSEKTLIENAITRAFADIPGGPWRITIARPELTTGSFGPVWLITAAGQYSITLGGIRSSADVSEFVARSVPSNN